MRKHAKIYDQIYEHVRTKNMQQSRGDDLKAQSDTSQENDVHIKKSNETLYKKTHKKKKHKVDHGQPVLNKDLKCKNVMEVVTLGGDSRVAEKTKKKKSKKDKSFVKTTSGDGKNTDTEMPELNEEGID